MKKERKLQIIDKFCVLLAHKNFENISIRDIAKECNVTPGTIYKHYKNKKEIIEAVFDFSAQNLLSNVNFNYETNIAAQNTFLQIIEYSKINICIFKLLKGINNTTEFSSEEINSLVEKYCIIYSDLNELIKDEMFIKYFIMLPLIDFCIDNFDNSDQKKAQTFVNLLILLMEEKLWK